MDRIVEWLELGFASAGFALWYFPNTCMLLAFVLLFIVCAARRSDVPELPHKLTHDEAVARLVEFMTRKRP